MKLNEAIEEYRKSTQLKRHHGDSRWYSRKHNLNWKPSVTSVIGSTLHKGIGFEKWLGGQPTYEAACEVRNKAAKRGTIVHEYCEDIMDGLSFDLREDKAEIEGCDMDEISKYLMSFEAWRYDVIPKLEVSELKLFHDEIPWSGTFDLICKISENLTMVDYKTGEHYKSHDVQLNMYRILWNKIFPDFKTDDLYGLYLKGRWIKGPNYKFKKVKVNEDICWQVWE